MTPRRALLTGLAVSLAWVLGAAWSGRLSPIARRPLLDGIAPPSPYRWVNPPPALAHMNQPPSSGTFPLAITSQGSDGGSFSTNDAQVTLIVHKGAIPPSPGASKVEISVRPLDPAKFGPPPGSLQIRGNVYRITASYEPKVGKVARARAPIETILAYPFAANDSGSHSLIFSIDGETWVAVNSNDLLSVAQVDGSLPRFGFVAVASPKSSPPPSFGAGSSPAGGESLPLSIVIIGAVLVILIAGFVVGIRGGVRRASEGGRARRSPSRRR